VLAVIIIWGAVRLILIPFVQGKVSDQDDWVTLRKHVNDLGIEAQVNSSGEFD
jgi:hypothetical protein